MKLHRGLAAGGSLAVLLMLALSSGAPPADDFEWLTDLDAARAAAAEQEKPLLVVFR